MRISLRIYFQDGSARDVVCNAADMVAFEDKFDVSVVKISTDARIGWLLYLAWHADKRLGNTKDDYDKWLDSVDSVGDSDADPKSKG